MAQSCNVPDSADHIICQVKAAVSRAAQLVAAGLAARYGAAAAPPGRDETRSARFAPLKRSRFSESGADILNRGKVLWIGNCLVKACALRD